MENYFEIVFLNETFEFLKSLDTKHSNKILYNIRKAQQKHDPELFKKLTDEIWEFRTLFQGLQYRLLAFWDKTDKANTLVISTHGFIKKQNRIPDNEIEKAEKQRTKYFNDKLKNRK
jgi:phage-related protein